MYNKEVGSDVNVNSVCVCVCVCVCVYSFHSTSPNLV